VGLYAPLTYLSNFYVGRHLEGGGERGGREEERERERETIGTTASNVYLAHAFAHVRYPDSIAPVLHGLHKHHNRYI